MTLRGPQPQADGMTGSPLRSLTIAVDGFGAVSALLLAPSQMRACFVFAHGAGAGMTHGFMTGVAESLAAHGVATLRFQFPYMEKGSKRPDSPALAQAADHLEAVQATGQADVQQHRGVVVFHQRGPGRSGGADMVDGPGLLADAVADGVGKHGVVFNKEQVHGGSAGHWGQSDLRSTVGCGR